MKALSIQQPWAWAILHAGKNWENRTWHTRYRGPLLIHAGKAYDPDGQSILDMMGCKLPPAKSLPRGGIVGVAELVNCVRACDIWEWNQWVSGPLCWKLEDARALEFIPCRGMLGLFEPPISPAKLSMIIARSK